MAVQRVFTPIALLFAACAAPQPVPQPIPVPATTQESIPAATNPARTVRFVDDKGARIAGARVRLTIDKEWVHVVSDDYGRIEIPDGELDRMRVSAPGRSTCVFFGGDLSSTYESILAMPKAARIAMTIRDQDGKLIVGQLVEAIASDERSDYERHAERIGVRTNSDGVAVFDDLFDTTYWLTAYDWQIWGSTDLYDVEAAAPEATEVNATVRGKPRDEFVEVLVTNLADVTWRDASVVGLGVQVKGSENLESVYVPGSCFLRGDTDEKIEVRLVETEAGYPKKNGWMSKWHPATVGQNFPLVLDARRPKQ